MIKGHTRFQLPYQNNILNIFLLKHAKVYSPLLNKIKPIFATFPRYCHQMPLPSLTQNTSPFRSKVKTQQRALAHADLDTSSMLFGATVMIIHDAFDF